MNNLNKSILIIGAGTGQLEAIKRAKELGLFVIAIDYNSNSIGFKYADKFEVISTKDIEKVVEYAIRINEEIGLDGVMTCGAEVSETVSAVAKALNLPGIPIEVAINCTDKLKRYLILKDHSVSCPNFFSVDSLEEIDSIKNKIKFPVVVKPIDKAGAAGVKKCNNYNELVENFKEAQLISGSKNVIIEEFLQGMQISTEAIIYNGEIYTTGFADRNYDNMEKFLPYFIEDGHTIPSILDEETKKMVIKETEKAIKALGINWGVAKGDVIICDGKPIILEMASRLSGGRFATDMVPLATGVDIVKVLIKMSIGEKIDINKELIPKFNRGAAQRFFLHEKSGLVRELSGISEAKNSMGVYDLMIEKCIKQGEYIDIIRSHHDRILHIIASGSNREEAVEKAELAISKIKLHYND